MNKATLKNIYVVILRNIKYILFIMGIYLLFSIKLPYIVYTPGGYISLNERIKVSEGYETSGEIGMAYVTMLKPTIPTILIALILPDWDVYPENEVTYDDESFFEMEAREKMYLKSATDSATIAAYSLANSKIDITATYNTIAYIAKEAKTTLQLGDVIKSVDNKQYLKMDDLINYLKTLKLNDIVTFEVERQQQTITATAKLYQTKQGPKIGIMTVLTFDYETDPKLEISFKDSESGPSGGLMTALAIYENLTAEDITKNRKIIGTGTIDNNGQVGEISGIKYKLIGAVYEKAEIFLCPKENLKEALAIKAKNNYKLKIIGVSTLNEALDELRD